MEGNKGAGSSDSRRMSNEGAPPADPENRRRGGAPWGRIIAALIGLLLLALLIPLACQALGSGGDSGGAGSTNGQQQGAAEETSRGQAQKGGGSTAASGKTTSNAAGDAAPAAGGDTAGGDTAGGGGTAASGGGKKSGEVARGPSGGSAAATGAVLETGGQQSGDGTTVTVPQAEISGTSGWLAIHANDNGQPGEVLGRAPLREGKNADVMVQLNKPVPSGKLYAMVHADEPNDDSYTFPEGDPPVEANGQVIVEPIQYTATGEQAESGDLPSSGGPNPLLLLSAVLVAVTLAGLTLARQARRR